MINPITEIKDEARREGFARGEARGVARGEARGMALGVALGHVRSVEALLARGRITAAEAREELEDLVRTGTIPAELGAQALARIA